MMKVKIYYVEVAPELESKEFDLATVIKSKGECIVGRSPECDLPLEGADLSRQHGRFLLKDNSYYFADLGSSNGSLFNGELAEPNHEYLLNIGDTIRLGDFVLKMEPAEEIAATVMKVLDPALFKPRPPQIVDASQPEPQISPVFPVVGLAAAAISMPMIVDRSQEELPDLAPPLPSGSIDDEVEQEATPESIISEPLPLVLIEDEWSNDNTSDYLQDSTFEQVVADRPLVGLAIEDGDEIELPNPVIPQYSTFEQAVADRPLVGLVIEDEDEIEQPDPVIPARSLSVLMLDDEEEEEKVPDPVVAAQSPSTVDLDELSEPAITTQPSFMSVIEDEEGELVEPVMGIQPPSTVVLDAAVVINDPEEPESELINSIVTEQPAEIVVVEDEEAIVAVPDSTIAVYPATTLEIEDEDSQELPDPFLTSQLPIGLVEEEADEDEDLSDLAVIEQLSSDVAVEEIEVAESSTQAENLQVESISDLPVTAVAVADEVSTHHQKFGAKLLSQKQIVLIAHDEKVADLTDLVDRHKDFLATCLTISWASIAGTLRQETGISVSKELPSGVSGGFQTLAGLVNSGDVLAVIFLKDFLAPAQTGQANEEALLRLCNINEILLATNIATAESIVHYLQS